MDSSYFRAVDSFHRGEVIQVPFELVRLVEEGERWHGEELTNVRRTLWWAKPKGCKGPKLLICTDGM